MTKRCAGVMKRGDRCSSTKTRKVGKKYLCSYCRRYRKEASR